MDNIVVISQNVKLESLSMLRDFIKSGSETLVFSTQLIFENEAEIIEKALDSKCTFKNFSDFMTDADFQKCDEDAYQGTAVGLSTYYDKIKEIKNQNVVERILKTFNCTNKIIVCDDLGLDKDVWLSKGFRRIECEYYHTQADQVESKCSFISRLLNVLRIIVSIILSVYRTPKHIAIKNGRKFIFYGSLNRIGYRLNLDFKAASNIQSVCDVISVVLGKVFRYAPKSSVVRMSTLHERGIAFFKDDKNLNLKLIQDGYLPPNYSSKYLLFNGANIEYYTWDVEGGRTFEYHNLPHRVIPFRNKLYLPKPYYPETVKKVLCVASGAGDWTAVKNRSDEDKMIYAFGKVAALFPEIEFIYRCHPVWIHPMHQGVNSINRAAEYIHWLNLPNLKISSNIPNANEEGKFRLSYKRSSFEEDLKDVDIVFGEHSISMIDAAFKNILFCSVNVTGRRDFFQGITQMGFPHCESIEEIVSLLNSLTKQGFKTNYEKAIANYNEMTDKEE